MLFLTCDPELPEESRVCLALKMVCGFRTQEIARGMLTTESAVQRRITRAKEKLQSLDREQDLYSTAWSSDRLESVLATIYLMFNEGYMVTSGEQLIRHDLCEESIRLATMLSEHELGKDPSLWALLALMEFHRSRFATRVDARGNPIPLDRQERTKWDWQMIRNGMMWMERSAVGDKLSAIIWSRRLPGSIVGLIDLWIPIGRRFGNSIPYCKELRRVRERSLVRRSRFPMSWTLNRPSIG